ncbi:hypothetical protein K437DRAFT_259646 [Tilletiaria anomala UBC 951]|uniref:Thioesterase/thiol ester dehydrase-isomerase n=1 Tax=Tilletiaria anomala (strain ATCC 24038 / CBS 436.72 / UBC 951) TaxID=1037660 RepID=A0A066VGD0_TILAU|nr:uncharacterized protein K437DRAFT_259646 [Tilletiaria anomala UBC 951]KDN37809.1 hypothetical protein K437DRAFT_259646 [Tilletiaria anomala UBC 951]
MASSSAPAADALDIYKLTRLKRIASPCGGAGSDEWVFESVTQALELMGNPSKIAYGGCALALAVTAAFQSLEGKDYAIYSMSAQYLGPTAFSQAVRLYVRSLRDTRTFCTRFLLIKQQQTNGRWRPTLSATCDFVAPQEADSVQTLLRFSVKPEHPNAPPPETLPSPDVSLKQLADEGNVTERELSEHERNFSPMARYADMRTVPDTPIAQKLAGIQYKSATSQDGRELAEKLSSDWFKATSNLPRLVEQADPSENLTLRALTAALTVFYLDNSMAFLPLTHSEGYWFPHVSACSSLDFVARWHTDSFDAAQWHLRELRALHGAHGRTFNEARIFDRQGELVLTSSQQAVMRASQAIQEEKLASKSRL